MSLPPVDFVGLRAAREAAEAEEGARKIAPLPPPEQRATLELPHPRPRGVSAVVKAAEARGFRTRLSYARGHFYHNVPPVDAGLHHSLVLKGDRDGEAAFVATWLAKVTDEDPPAYKAYSAYAIRRDLGMRSVGMKVLTTWIKSWEEA